MYFNNCWSFKHAFNIDPSKNLTYSNKTLFYSYTLQHEDLSSRNLIPCILTLFGQNSATLSPLSTSILKKAGVAWPGPCPASSRPRLHTCPTDDTATDAAEEEHREAPTPPPPRPRRRKPQRRPRISRRPQEAAAKSQAAKGGGRRAALLT